jgi:LAO/AO transport system kinase
MKKTTSRPEWTPENAGTEFASHVLPAAIAKENNNPSYQKMKNLSFKDYKEGVLNKDKTILAKAITLIESNAEKHFRMGSCSRNRMLCFNGRAHGLRCRGLCGLCGES